MKIRVLDSRTTLGRAAAEDAAELIRRAIARRGIARILAASGGAQVEFLAALVEQRGLAWGEVEMFHVEEYVGLAVEHPGSVRRFLFDRLIGKARVGRYHLLDGATEPDRACRQAGAQLAAAPIDVAMVSLEENGGIAFNEPPADFATELPYLVVRLDEAARRRQADQGGFATAADVPERAIALSLRQLLKARAIVCVAPDARCAAAVRRCIEGPVSPLAPGSILRTHPAATLYLERASAALLRSEAPGEKGAEPA